MTKGKNGNGHKHSLMEELRSMSDVQLVEEVASEDEAHRLQSEAELQRRLSERVAGLNRTMIMMTGVILFMNVVLMGLAYLWLKPRLDMGHALKRASDVVDLHDVRRRAGGVIGGAGDVLESARETAGHSLHAASSGLEKAGSRIGVRR